jgi:hypothetical protein
MTNHLINIFVFALQGIVTFLALLTIYMIFVLLDYQGGIDGFIATTFIQPIFGGILSALTILVCLLIGLPIRLHKKIKLWWTKNYLISILGIITGFGLILASFLPTFTEFVEAKENDVMVTREIPNLTMVIFGWTTIGFFILHTFPTDKIIETVKKTANKIIDPVR